MNFRLTRQQTFFTIFFLLIATFLSAQNRGSKTDTSNIKLLQVVTEPITVSALRFPEKVVNVPQRVSILDQKAIRYLNPSNTADLLQLTGEVLVQKSQGGGGSPIIRGFEANRVLIVVDGVRMNNAIFRGGHLQNVLRIDNAILDKTELLFGPGAVAYGSDALGGVMHFTTLSPKFSTLIDTKALKVNGNAYTRVGSAANEFTQHFHVNIANNRWAFLGSATYANFGDIRQGRNPVNGAANFWLRNNYVQNINGKDSIVTNKDPLVQVGTAYEQRDYVAKLAFAQKPGVKHMLNFQYSNTGNVPRYDRLTDLNNQGGLARGDWYYGPENRLLTAYQLENMNATKLFTSYKVVASYQQVMESRNTRGLNSLNLTQRQEQLAIYGINIDFEYKKSNKVELRYGVENYYNNVNSTANTKNIVTQVLGKASTRYPSDGSTMNLFGAYLTALKNINNKWIVSAGTRFNSVGLTAKFNDTSFYKLALGTVNQNNNALVGSAGLVFKPNAYFSGYGSVSTAFRAPNVDDMGKVFEGTTGRFVVVPNTNLQPERSINFETGVNVNVKGISLSLTGWYTVVQQLISMQPTTFQGQDSIRYDGLNRKVLSLQNAQEGFVTGASFALRYTYNKISFAVNGNYTYGRIKTDTTLYPLDHIPPFFGKAELKYQHAKWNISFFSMFNGWKRINQYNKVGEDNLDYATPNGMPAWVTFNVRGGLWLNQHFTCYASVENIFDKRYRIFASGVSAPGINVTATLAYTF